MKYITGFTHILITSDDGHVIASITSDNIEVKEGYTLRMCVDDEETNTRGSLS